MKGNKQAISEEMYYRVYRLLKRNADPHIIAAALDLPLRIVLNVIARLQKKAPSVFDRSSKTPESSDKKATRAAFLDVYVITKARYSIVQLVGHVVKEQKPLLDQELQKIQSSIWKLVALRMADVVMMDETGARALLDFATSMFSRERYVALLDPSAHIEPLITRYQIEGKIPIFGTVNAFETAAFAYQPHTSSQQKKRHSR